VDSAADGDHVERFARALESPSGPLGPELELDLAIVEALRTLGPQTAPDEQARERMRQRVLAKASPAVSSRRRRFAVASVAALALVFALAGISLLLSGDALPGDTLYGVKRTAEAASLGLTFGEEPKALKHLEFAAARVSEMETLTRRADTSVGGYLTALVDFDADTTQASRQLTSLAVRGGVKQLNSLRSWVGQQDARLAALNAHLPAAARERKDVSRQLLAKIDERSTALLDRTDCYQVATAGSDDIGALPASSVCRAPTGAATPGTATSGTGTPRTDTTGAPAPSGVPAPRVKPSVPQAPAPAPQLPAAPPQAPRAAAPAPRTSGPPSSVLTVPPRPVDPSLPPLPVTMLKLPPLLPSLPAIHIG
jgi:hypothetical protein